jgi:hypothetical protein
MGYFMCPVVMIEVPVWFKRTDKPKTVDLQELGIVQDENIFDPEVDTIDPISLQIDRILGFAPTKTSDGKEWTVLWVDNLKWWTTMPYEKFKSLHEEKVNLFNKISKEM